MFGLFSRFANRPTARQVRTAAHFVAESPTVDAIRILDAILRAAVADGASDVHFEPKEDGLLVRFRIDGEMHDHAKSPLAER